MTDAPRKDQVRILYYEHATSLEDLHRYPPEATERPILDTGALTLGHMLIESAERVQTTAEGRRFDRFFIGIIDKDVTRRFHDDLEGAKKAGRREALKDAAERFRQLSRELIAQGRRAEGYATEAHALELDRMQ